MEIEKSNISEKISEKKYSKYMFFNFTLSTLQQRKKFCDGGVKNFEDLKTDRISKKIVPTLNPREMAASKKMVDEAANLQHDIEIIDPLFDDIASEIFETIEKEQGVKFITLKVVKSNKSA